MAMIWRVLLRIDRLLIERVFEEILAIIGWTPKRASALMHGFQAGASIAPMAILFLSGRLTAMTYPLLAIWLGLGLWEFAVSLLTRAPTAEDAVSSMSTIVRLWMLFAFAALVPFQAWLERSGTLVFDGEMTLIFWGFASSCAFQTCALYFDACRHHRRRRKRRHAKAASSCPTIEPYATR